MGDVLVRTAGPDDWAVIADFNCRLAIETENKRLDPDLVGPGVRALLADPQKGRYFLASHGDAVVGQLMHTGEWSDWRNGQIWWLQSVYVVPEFRRKGVFRLLYEHLHGLAQLEPDVVGIRLYVENENCRAQETYRNMGLNPAGYSVMEKFFGLPAVGSDRPAG